MLPAVENDNPDRPSYAKAIALIIVLLALFLWLALR